MYIHTHPPTPFISAVITEDNDSWSWNKNVYIYVYIYIYQTRTKFVEKEVHILPKAVAHPRSPPISSAASVRKWHLTSSSKCPSRMTLMLKSSANMSRCQAFSPKLLSKKLNWAGHLETLFRKVPCRHIHEKLIFGECCMPWALLKRSNAIQSTFVSFHIRIPTLIQSH